MSTRGLAVITAANASPMTLDGTRTYVVGVTRPVVIDPGPDDPRHLEAILTALGGASPISIVLTHLHADHSDAAPALSRVTGAPVLAGPAAAAEYLSRNLGDGDTIDTDRGALRVVATPGHAPEHIVLHWAGHDAPVGGAVFLGDHIMGEGNTTLVAAPEGDVADYLRSLDRIAGLGARIGYSAHGPVIDDLPGAIRRYRAHRLERVEEVERAREALPTASIEELVDHIYGETIPHTLRGVAAGSVRAMMEYLSERSGGEMGAQRAPRS